jgi:hypothetical protein
MHRSINIPSAPLPRFDPLYPTSFVQLRRTTRFCGHIEHIGARGLAFESRKAGRGFSAPQPKRGLLSIHLNSQQPQMVYSQSFETRSKHASAMRQILAIDLLILDTRSGVKHVGGDMLPG